MNLGSGLELPWLLCALVRCSRRLDFLFGGGCWKLTHSVSQRVRLSGAFRNPGDIHTIAMIVFEIFRRFIFHCPESHRSKCSPRSVAEWHVSKIACHISLSVCSVDD